VKFTRILPVLTLAAGVSLLALAAACGGDKKEEAATAAPSAAADTATPTATATATATSTPTPTPTPFSGRVGKLQIPSLKVDSPIEELGLTKDNYMDTPKNTNTHVGWYSIWDRPGWGGNAVFSAHIYYHSIPAPFQKLSSLKAGDEVDVVMEDGTKYTYQVITKNRYHRDNFPTGEVIWPPNRNGKEWITLITCGGELDSTGQEYVSRDVVVAERVAKVN